MVEKPLFDKKPEEFYIINEAYIQHKNLFDLSLALLRASDDQMLFMSLVKLCNDGRGDIAKILLRSLFENFVNAIFIRKHQLGEIFIDYRVAATKKFYDAFENKFPDSPLLATGEFREFRVNLEKMFGKVKHRYTNRNGRILNSWSKKDLRAKSRDIGELLTCDYIMSIYSAYVHCDPVGTQHYVRNEKNETILDNNPRIDDLEELLNLSSVFFREIVINWARAFNAEVPQIFLDPGSSPG
jgi:hypothetical protein